jgi:hypothetical protein
MRPGGNYELLLSEKQIKTWNFTKDGKLVSGKKEWVSLLVKNIATGVTGPFYLTLANLKTYKGAQISQYDTIFISVVGSEELLSTVRSYIDSQIYNLLFHKRYELLPGADRFTSPKELAFVLPSCVVRRGELKKDANDPTARYGDSMIFGIPSKKTSSGVVVDTNLCTIEDPDGGLFSWEQLAGKDCEVSIGIDIRFSGAKIDVNCTSRSIVPNATSIPKVLSSARLKRRTQDAHQAAMLVAQQAAAQQPPAPTAPLPTQINASPALNANMPMTISHDLFEPLAKRPAV